jgi:Gpi18-like mannosyltransferase
MNANNNGEAEIAYQCNQDHEPTDSSSEIESLDENSKPQVHADADAELHNESIDLAKPTITSTLHATMEPTLSRAQWLQAYLIAAVFCNFYILFFDGHFDIDFWKNWTTQLATTGFSDYRGDYPPLWSNWLYVVSKFYNYFHIPIENNFLFKHLTQLPVVAYHLLLTYLIYKILEIHCKNTAHFHAALCLTVFNPAILFNGPIWGQIDVTPLVPLIAALMAGVSKRYQVFMLPLYILAMLTKFQMIAFAPVFGILFFRNIKSHLVGLLLCIPTFLIAFLPAILAKNFVQAFTLPYISSMSMFSSATMGASNIWLLTVGDLAPDNIILFDIDPNSQLASLFKLKHFGMIIFSLISLLIFIAGMKKLSVNRFKQNQDVMAGDMFFYAVVCATTFFTILPGMHERYLLPAAIVALAYFATSPSKAFYPISLTLISAVNLTMSHGIKTTLIWPSLALIMTIIFLYAFFELLLGQKWPNFIHKIATKILSFKWVGVAVFLINALIMTTHLYQKNKIYSPEVQENQILLTQIKPMYTKQDYGKLQVNTNINGGTLRIGGKRFANGFGTHANSVINFKTPENAKSLSFIAGLDSYVVSASITFYVWGDGKLLWQSPLITRSEKNSSTITVDITGVKEISLRVSSMGDIRSDHANWVNPIITLSH